MVARTPYTPDLEPVCVICVVTQALSGEWRTALRQRVQDTAGAVGVAMLDALDTGHGTLLLPIGLVCEFSSLQADSGR